MALFTGNIRSSVLDMDTQLTIMLPHDYQKDRGAKPKKTVFLLHGLKQNASSWARFSCAEGCADHHDFALVIPEVQRSWYSDMEFGHRYYTYITEELPALVGSMFNVATDRESLCVAGLSMGGYGAVKCALGRPDVFSAAASFSGGLDIHEIISYVQKVGMMSRGELEAIFGHDLSVKEKDDPFILAQKTALLAPSLRPRLYVCCGTEDTLITGNRLFDALLKTLPYDYQYMEWAGIHDWSFWDKAIEYALDFFDGVRPSL